MSGSSETKLQANWYSEARPPFYLVFLSLLFAWLVSLRKSAYKSGLLASRKSSIPLVVVGNITVGGTGKTLFISWLWKWLAEQGIRAAIISRGYGGHHEHDVMLVDKQCVPEVVGDEPCMLARQGIGPIVVSARRKLAIDYVETHLDVDMIVSDDGLQHYAMQRDLELVLLDGDRGLGNGRLLPAGPLREPATRLSEVDYLFSKGEDRHKLGARMIELNPGILQPLNPDEGGAPPKPGDKVHAVAGIGNPESFFSILEKMGYEPVRHPFRDHAQYQVDDLQFPDSLPLVMTEKDAVKCKHLGLGNAFVLPLDIKIDKASQEAILNDIRQLLGSN